MPENIKYSWEPQPGPQTEFLRRNEYECLYGGAAGGGKTDAILGDALDAVEHPKYRALILRRTFKQLSKGGAIIDRSFDIYKPLGARYLKGDYKWTFPSGATIEFGHCESEKDIYNYQGSQYQRVYFDELTQFTEFQYKYMYSRVRSNYADIKARLRSTANPGGIGHAWVKRWFNPSQPYIPMVDPETGLHRIFIPAKVWDNKFYNPNSPECTDPQYVKGLMMMPEDQRRMLLEGDWDIFAGQFFNMFRNNLHIVQPFSIPDNWLVGYGIDYGYRDPFCWLEGALDMREYPTLYITNELYQADVSPQENARAVCRMLKPRRYSSMVIGKDVRKKLPQKDEAETGVTILDLLAEGGLDSLDMANDHRISGWAAISELLTWEGPIEMPKRFPRIKIFSTCANLIRTLPELIKDETYAEDIDRNGEDHAADALRYLVMSFYRYFKDRQQKDTDEYRQRQRAKRQIDYHHLDQGYLV